MKVNFVLVDFENVQPLKFEKLLDSSVQILVFLGSKQGTLPVELVKGLQPFGQAARYITISGSGTNALDFHIAYYLGKLATEHPDACFHVISKDRGYDPLITHLKTLNVECKRSTSLEQIRSVKAASSTSGDRIAAAKALFANPRAPKPRTMAKLRIHLRHQGHSDLTESDLDEMVHALRAANLWSERK